jgi:hypothetical protein
MRFLSLFVYLSVIGVALPALAQPTPSVPSLSQEQVDRLNLGEILVDLNTELEPPVGDALGVIDASAEACFAIISDFSIQSTWVEDIILSEVTGEEEGGIVLTRGITDTPWPMEDRVWSNRTWNGQTEVDGVMVYVSWFDYIPGSGNLEDVEGYWLLIPWGDDGSKTLLRYHIAIDLGTPMPDFLLNWGTENMLPTRVMGLRSHFD